MKIEKSIRLRANNHSPRTIRCSIADIMISTLAPSVVFFYDRKLDDVALMNGLQKVLEDFPHFNASLRSDSDNLYIECDNTGVSFSVVHRTCAMAAAMQEPADLKSELRLVEQLQPKQVMRGKRPVFSVRVSHFSDNKSCMAFSYHHAVGDLQTIMQLLRAWSETVAGQGYPKPVLVDDREDYLSSRIEDSSRAEAGVRFVGFGELFRLVPYLLTTARDQEAIAFYFTPEEIVRMKAAFQSDSSERISANDVICAHMFSVLAVRDPRRKLRYLSCLVDYRQRAKLPDEVIVGNMVSVHRRYCEPGKAASAIARDLRASMKSYATDHMDYWQNRRAVEAKGRGHIGRFLNKGLNPLEGNMVVSNWMKAGFYDVRFGGDRPVYFCGLGRFPFPWMASLVEGFYGEGALFGTVVPRAVRQSLVTAESLREIHQYRDADAPLPSAAATSGAF